VTPSVSNAGSSLKIPTNQGISNHPQSGLHPGLHYFAENDGEPRLTALAAALRALSPEERDQLAAMLLGKQTGRTEGGAGGGSPTFPTNTATKPGGMKLGDGRPQCRGSCSQAVLPAAGAGQPSMSEGRQMKTNGTVVHQRPGEGIRLQRRIAP
jgi:hypothetical protein